MITLFRNFAKSKWAVGLLVVLALSLLITGGSQMDVFSSLGTRHVITAGDRSVGEQKFRLDADRVRANIQEQAGRPVTFEDMAGENIITQYVETQTQRLGFLAWAWKSGIRPGEDLVIQEIRKVPAFFNQVTGAFSQETYEDALGQRNITPEELEREFRDQYATQHFGTAVFAGARLPRVYGALLAAQALETRDGRWFTVTQAMAGATPAPTDAQLTAFINENAAQLRRPEFRIASVVLFNPAQTAAPPAIPEARIVERFEFRKAALSQPETRDFVTLTAPTREAAAGIAAALRAGQTPAQAGAAANIEPVASNATPQSAIPDPAVGAGVFRTAAGQISDPIQARVGFTVARVTAINPAAPATLESARAAVIAELQEEDAKSAVYARVERYEAARQAGKTLVVAAEESGARIVQLPPFTQDGRLPDNQPMNAPPQILETAYNLTKGGESEVIDAGQGQYFVLRLDDVRPAALPTLAEVREPLAAQWTARENARRLTARAEALAAQVRGGQDIAAVAAAAGAALTTRASVGQNPQVQQELGEGLLQGLFGQGKGQVFTGPASQNTFVVGHVDAIRPAVPALAAPIAEQIRGRLGQELLNAAVEQSFTAAATRTKAKNDPALARQALGLPETPAPVPGAAPSASAPAAPAAQ